MLVPFLLWIIMRKRPAVSSFAAGVVSLTGIALLSLNERLTMGAGEILTLISTGAFALQLILIGLFAKEDNPIQLTFFQFISAGALASIFALIVGQPVIGAGREAVTGVIYLIVLNTVVAFIAQNKGQPCVSDFVYGIAFRVSGVGGHLRRGAVSAHRYRRTDDSRRDFRIKAG